MGGSRRPVDLTGRAAPLPAELTGLLGEFVSRAVREPGMQDAPPAAGDPRLRAVLAGLLGESADGLCVTTGVRDAAYALASAYRDRPFVVEEPGFSGIADAVAQAGARVTGAGWDVLAAPAGPPADLPADSVCWVTPFARSPDGARLSAARRGTLAVRAEQGALVVSNEVYRWHSAAPDRLPGGVRVGSLSKVAGSGVRLGWLAGDGPTVAAVAPKLVGRPPAVWQRAWALLLEEVGLEPFLKGPVADALAAKDEFLDLTLGPHRPPRGDPDGTCLLWSTGCPEPAALALAAQAGVLLSPGRAFAAPHPSVRLAFSALGPGDAAVAAAALTPLLTDGTLTPLPPEGALDDEDHRT